jgi:serine protease AprX
MWYGVFMIAKMRQHEHIHSPNKFAVIPTPVRLNANTEHTGKGVTIAFLDSGFYPHPDLVEPVSRILAYHDITQQGARLTQNAQPHPWQWHGTQTSVVACGNGNLSDGIYRGLASDAQLVLVKVSDKGRITDENIVRGLRWVMENKERYNIRIVSMSLGGDEDASYNESLLDQAAEEAVKAGLVVVVAAGNSGCGSDPRPIPPANSPSVITVGGYHDNNQLGLRFLDLYCSNYGMTIDGLMKPEIVAPAMWVAAPILPNSDNYKRAEALSQIAETPDYLLRNLINLSSDPDYVLCDLACTLWKSAALPGALHEHRPDTIRALVDAELRDNKIVAAHYQHVDGTSFATPIVASVIAQMLEANPTLTPAAIKNILISTADRIPDTTVIRQGYGVLHAGRAVDYARDEHHVFEANEILSPHIENGHLVFSYHDDRATQVAVAGDFNNWQALALIKQANGIWRTEFVPPATGTYRYKFVVNQQQWLEDPANWLKEPDEFGGFNSLLNLA